MKIEFEKIEPIIRGVREIVMPHHGNIKFTSKTKNAADVVTEIDVKVENFLKAKLNELYPEIVFVGEETGGDRTSRLMWLCDPIDGTAHFVRGTPFCTTMLALIEDGKVIASFIYDFIRDNLYHAELGKGAYKNDQKIHVSDKPIELAYMSWETHMEKPENLELFKKLDILTPYFHLVVAGYEFAMVAEGSLDGRISFDPYGKDYDYAPGSLLVSEAGGVVRNIGRNDYDYKNLDFIAANPKIYKSLTEGSEAIFPIENE